jgi:DsbC/DsbD-like thiol-disulfide interchange protein
MTIATRWIQIVVLTAAASLVGTALAGESSWQQGFHSRVRLISGGDRDGRRLAGIEVVLDDGFKTYWRTPGDAGLPPRFDWSGSDNAAALEILWPAPTRTEDAGGVTFGYGGRVVLPVLVSPADPSKPVDLKLALDYGVCKDICIPAHADLELTLPVKADAGQTSLEHALAAVPRPQPVGSDAPLAVVGAERIPGEKPSFSVRVRAPAGTSPVLFAEGPEDWYLTTSAAPGGDAFKVTIDEHPNDPAADVLLKLTLVAGEQAIESELRLDGNLQPR